MAESTPSWFVPSATRDTHRLFTTRALRGFADGAVSVVIASYFTALGFSSLQIGTLMTATLMGSAALTLGVGLVSRKRSRRRLLLGASLLMLATGLAFSLVHSFALLLLIAVVGTMNPSSGDVSVFLPVEQAAVTEALSLAHFTQAFAWYNLLGALAGALGALASGLPALLVTHRGWHLIAADRLAFLLYGAIAIASFLVYRTLSPAVEGRHEKQSSSPLARSRKIVMRLALLFSLDAFGGGFVVQAMLALWLYRRFSLPIEQVGLFFFASGILSAFSQLLAPKLATKMGRINTMVFTHLPANVLLITAALMPTAPLTIACLLGRALLSQMDVPARQSYVMAVVPPEERAAAASVTNVPRSLASALSPLLAGYLLDRSSFGWPLLCTGFLKIFYDLLLLIQFRSIRPADEQTV